MIEISHERTRMGMDKMDHKMMNLKNKATLFKNWVAQTMVKLTYSWFNIEPFIKLPVYMFTSLATVISLINYRYSLG